MFSIRGAVLCRSVVLKGENSVLGCSFVSRRTFHEKDSIHEWFRLMNNNKEWVAETNKRDPEYFKVLNKAQFPPFLFIGCADSRLPLTNFTKTGPGEFFVHRNIANQISMTDINFLASLEFAVNVLKVRHILVAGHYNCGGIRASVEGVDSGIIGNWVQPIRRMYLKNRAVLDKLPENECLNQLTEMNVVQQIKNLVTTKVMMETIFATPKKLVPTVHGVVIDLSDGLMKEVPMPFDEWKSRNILPADFDNNGYIVSNPKIKNKVTLLHE